MTADPAFNKDPLVNVIIWVEGGIPHTEMVSFNYEVTRRRFKDLVRDMGLDEEDNPTCHRFAWDGVDNEVRWEQIYLENE